MSKGRARDLDRALQARPMAQVLLLVGPRGRALTSQLQTSQVSFARQSSGQYE